MEKAKEIEKYSKSALSLMAQCGIQPTPENYTVFFGYFTGEDEALVDTLGEALGQTAGITTTFVEDLYEKFFGVGRRAEAVREASQNVNEMVSEVLDLLKDARNDQGSYGTALSDYVEKMGSDPSGAEAAILARSILFETRAIIAKTQTVEAQLEESSREVETLRKNLEEVQREALTDALTGIANRRSFDITLRNEASSAQENNEDLCMFLADIDHFKKFNDTYGHLAGDSVIKYVASAITNGIKGRDMVARYGGEEFAVILPNTDLTGALAVARNLCANLADKELRNRKSGKEYGTVTMSIGVVQYRPGEPLDALVARADAGLYRAKDNGRNGVAVESPRQEAVSVCG